MHHDAPVLLAFAHKLGLTIRKEIEEGKPDGLDEGGLARAIGPTDAGGAAPQINGEVTIAFNILQLDACDEHDGMAFPGSPKITALSHLVFLFKQQESGNAVGIIPALLGRWQASVAG